MGLTQLAYLGEFIGGVAVLVTLIYLASQVRHSTRVALTSNHAAMIGDLRSIYRAVAQDVSLAKLVVRGEQDFASLSEVDRRRFLEFANLLFGIWEQAQLCHQNGTIDESTWIAAGESTNTLRGAVSFLCEILGKRERHRQEDPVLP